jgi:hypothetical protein
MTISRTKLPSGSSVGRATGGALPGLLDRHQQPRIGQQPVQPGQLHRQLADLGWHQLIEQRLDLPPVNRSIHPSHRPVPTGRIIP